MTHELGVLSSLSGPGCARVLGLERDGHGMALVLADAGGQSLRAVLARARRSVWERLELAVAIAHAVANVHRQGVVHAHLTVDHVLVVSRPVDERNPNAPAVVADLVQGLLSKAPADRYQWALGVARDVKTPLQLKWLVDTRRRLLQT